MKEPITVFIGDCISDDGGIMYSRDGVDHVQAHLDGAVRMVRAWLRQPRHTVVAVSQDLYPQAVVVLDIQRPSTLLTLHTL